MKLPSPAMVVALIALVISASGVSYAVGRSSNQTINACQNTKTGALSIKSKCAKSEKMISWNVSGPRGEKGDSGAVGARGAAGPAGPQGPAGEGAFRYVVDANGDVVGDLLGIDVDGGGTTLRVGDASWRQFYINMNASQVTLTAVYDEAVWSNASCAGAPRGLLNGFYGPEVVPGDGGWHTAFVSGIGGELKIWESPSNGAVTTTWNNGRSYYKSSPSGVCEGPFTVSGGPWTLIDDYTESDAEAPEFAPPLSLDW